LQAVGAVNFSPWLVDAQSLTTRPVAASESRIVPSMLLEASSRPSGLNVTAKTGWSCPVSRGGAGAPRRAREVPKADPAVGPARRQRAPVRAKGHGTHRLRMNLVGELV
jgi:hypothetical protein